MTSSIEIDNLTRRLDHSVPDGDFAPETRVESLTRRLDHSVPDGDFAPTGTAV
ncbi:hypothetical protein OOK31_36495 [Streptomyces sp. NBC_00249]|uniref:hypothetical protein n=1 Tax=Streptomyces sp. NBC_00249 TaxID=2975690 RepID=UPI002254516E|nr:hypothetical protein [Streptomyces sp. NBC_00249]MCX5199314.1 hypothetical protein [Streptomyces sp. NBC_00249]